jgi:hypothetical protein
LVLRHKVAVWRIRGEQIPCDAGSRGESGAPVRDAADLRSIRRKPVVAGLINEYHQAA